MRTNKVKTKIKAGEKTFGIRLTYPDPQIIEIMGTLGFDFVFIDAEHGSFTIPEVETLCRVADSVGVVPLAKSPNLEPSTILKLLDTGVMGIDGPHIETKADAQALVNACRFAPQGERSFGSVRGNEYGMVDKNAHMARFNEEVLVWVTLENVKGLNNLKEILTVPGVDVMSVGPADMAQSMGLPGRSNHPDVLRAMDDVAKQTRAAGKVWRRELMLFGLATDVMAQGLRNFMSEAKSGKPLPIH